MLILILPVVLAEITFLNNKLIKNKEIFKSKDIFKFKNIKDYKTNIPFQAFYSFDGLVFKNLDKANYKEAELAYIKKHVVVLDADNVMAPDFLDCVDHSIIKDNGNTAIQAHRLAKNTNSTIALLDAINEETGNNILRKGHVTLGFS